MKYHNPDLVIDVIKNNAKKSANMIFDLILVINKFEINKNYIEINYFNLWGLFLDFLFVALKNGRNKNI